MKKRMTNLMLILILIVGLSLLLYPTVSDYWNSLHQSKAISSYAEDVAAIDDDRYQAMLADAAAYNQALLGRDNPYLLSDEMRSQYVSLLDISGNGIMGYIEIPQIECTLPIYHGAEDSVLQVAIGHLDWTSLPIGGESTHCVVSGHRGLPSAKLFTDLDKLAKGDIFIMRTLDETLTYEVDQILIVEPDDTTALLVEPGKDYCTLVTCTPYGVNSHRMLVRGHRVDDLINAQQIRITADAMVVEKMLVMPFVLLPILLVMLIFLLVATRQPKPSVQQELEKSKDRRNPK